MIDQAAPNDAREASRTRAWALAIVLSALVVRVIYVLEMRASPLFFAPLMDAKYHVEWASAFARGADFQPGPFFRAPLYPWFLGVCFRVFGVDLLAPRLIQAAFGALTVGLTYLIGARVFARRVGLWASAAAACSWLLVFYDGELLLESLAIPLNLLGLWLALRFDERRTSARAALAGVAFGLAAITRPNVLPIALAIGAAIAWRDWRASRRVDQSPWRTAATLAVYLLALGAPIAPITYYNSAVGGDRVLISSQAGVNLWIGNNPQSDGATAIVPGTRADWWGGYQDSIALAENARGRKLKPSEVSSYYTERSLDFWRTEPSKALALFARKVRLLWLDWEIGNNEEPRFIAQHFAPLSKFLPYSFGVVGALAAIGALASLRRAGAPRLLALFTVGYAASVVLFFVCSRYRAPIVPPLLVYAAFGVDWIRQRARERRFVALGLAALVAATSACLSWIEPALLRTSDAAGFALTGVAYAASGQYAEALDALDRALALDPNDRITARQRADVLRQAGRFDEAAAAYESLLAQQPDDAAALDAYADLELARHELAHARALAERQMSLASGNAHGWYNRGRVAVEAGDLDGAANWFQGALDREPDDFKSAYALAMTRTAQGRADDARALFQRAVGARTEPEQLSFLRDAFLRLASLEASRGAREEALRVLDRALAQFVGDRQLAELRAKIAAR